MPSPHVRPRHVPRSVAGWSPNGRRHHMHEPKELKSILQTYKTHTEIYEPSRKHHPKTQPLVLVSACARTQLFDSQHRRVDTSYGVDLLEDYAERRRGRCSRNRQGRHRGRRRGQQPISGEHDVRLCGIPLCDDTSGQEDTGTLVAAGRKRHLARALASRDGGLCRMGRAEYPAHGRKYYDLPPRITSSASTDGSSSGS